MKKVKININPYNFSNKGNENGDNFNVFNLLREDNRIDYSGMDKAFSVRIPIEMNAFIDTISKKSGKSKNALIVEILTIGIGHSWDSLGDDERKELEVYFAENPVEFEI